MIVTLKPFEGMPRQRAEVIREPEDNNGVFLVKILEEDRLPDDFDGLVEVPADQIEKQ